MKNCMSRYAICVMLILIGASKAGAAEITVTWTGTGGNDLWSNANNWQQLVVPCNAGAVEVNVIIPAGAGTIIHDIAGSCTIKTFVLGVNSTLLIDPGTSLIVEETATIEGRIDAEDGDFTALDPSSSFPGNRANFLVDSPFGSSSVTIAAPTYSSKGFSSTNNNTSVVTYNWPLMTVSGVDSLLDLSALTSIDAGFNSSGNDNDFQKITANSGGYLDLSGEEFALGGVLDITTPSDRQDRLEINIADPGTVINLSKLQSITSAGAGYARLDATNGAFLDLPMLSTINQTVFDVNGASTISVANSPATYSSIGFSNTNNNTSVVTYNWPLMTVSGAGSLLDLSALTSINAGFNSGGNDNDIQKINANSGGILDLSGVTGITTPSDSNDRLEFNISDGSTLDLTSFTTVDSAGSGRLNFNISGGSSALLPSLGDMGTGSTITVSGASIFQIGNLTVSASTTTMILNDAGTTLDVDGTLILSSNLDLTAAPDTIVTITGDMVVSHTVEVDAALGGSVVHFDGSGTELDPQLLEVGGLDIDISVEFLTNDNFGFGQMIIGQPGVPTVVRLQDLVDNGNGACEALYLWGNQNGGTASQGLVIHTGSVLILDEIHVYDYNGTAWIRIDDSFSPGVTEIAYSNGLIKFGSSPTLCVADIVCDGTVNVTDLLALLAAWGDCPAPCLADTNEDGSVNVTDLLALLAAWGPCP